MNQTYDLDWLDALRQACAGQARPGPPKRFVRLFQPRFAALVESGHKCQTIRPPPHRIPYRGDILDLRTWTGRPYASRQRRLLEAPLGRIEACRIQEDGIYKPPGEGSILDICGAQIIRLHGTEADRFARDDGFADWAEMQTWFAREHGLPFDGVILSWAFPHAPVSPPQTTNHEPPPLKSP